MEKNEGKHIGVYNKEQYLALHRKTQKLYHSMVSKPGESDTIIDVYIYSEHLRGYIVNERVDSLPLNPVI